MPQDKVAWVTGAASETSRAIALALALPAMPATGGGSIVDVASILGQVAFAGAPACTSAKHGVIGLTKVVALEYSAQGMRVNAVGPAFIHTPMIARLEDDETARA